MAGFVLDKNNYNVILHFILEAPPCFSGGGAAPSFDEETYPPTLLEKPACPSRIQADSPVPGA